MERLALPYLGSAQPYFQHLAHETGAIWFHSGQPARPGHRWEWCSAWPTERFGYLGQGRVRHRRGDAIETRSCGDFFEFLSRQHRPRPRTDLPFASGLAGHLDYELGYELQGIECRHPVRNQLASVDRYDWSLIVDHQEHRCELVIQVDCPPSIQDRIRHRLLERAPPAAESTDPVSLRWHALMSSNQYRHRFERLRDYILAGDIYQANLTRQWQAGLTTDISDWALYRQLAAEVPAPFSVFHRAADHTLLSVSPERFLTIEDGRMITQPIKGTRPRGRTKAEDKALAEALSGSEKDRAENLMIVDLLRNDLSRNAATGSVRVPDLFKLESFSNVHHLVSTVTARLKQGASPLHALRDAFPGGSITGAPKRRAMQIIDELELVARGGYCGSAFWLSDDGYLDSNILIRSLVRQGDRLLCSGGGGIVADSDCEEEYQESATKVRQLLSALGTIED